MEHRFELRRLSGTSPFQTREENGKIYICGYFAVYNSIYNIGHGLSESIAPGAFDETITDDIRGLVNHDTTLVLGRTTVGTLTLRLDEKGLYGEIEINQADSDAMNLYSRVKRGDVSQCSFGFEILEEDTEYREDGSIHWTLKKVKLYEVSVCTFPAYEDTSVEARRKDAENIKKRNIEAAKASLKKRMEALSDGTRTD